MSPLASAGVAARKGAEPAAQDATPAPQSTTPSGAQVKPKQQPATTKTPKADLSPPIKASRLQLALGRSTLTGVLSVVFVAAALGIGILWIRKHLRAVHRYLVKGERYVIRHPLTDIGMLIIAGLLFILSQTAGLIQ